MTMIQQQPTEPEFTNSEQSELPLGSIWIKCAWPTFSLGLEQVLKAHATHVHRGQKPPVGDSASLVIFFCLSAKDDVASEVEHLRALAPNTSSVVVCGLSADLQLARSALKAGARGFIHVGMQPEQIVRALLVATMGDVVLPRELLNHLLLKEQSQGDPLALTTRQREILELVAEGESNAQIASRLFLSESTIKQHLRSAYKILGVKNRTQAARLFRRNNPGHGQGET